MIARFFDDEHGSIPTVLDSSANAGVKLDAGTAAAFGAVELGNARAMSRPGGDCR